MLRSTLTSSGHQRCEYSLIIPFVTSYDLLHTVNVAKSTLLASQSPPQSVDSHNRTGSSGMLLRMNDPEYVSVQREWQVRFELIYLSVCI